MHCQCTIRKTRRFKYCLFPTLTCIRKLSVSSLVSKTLLFFVQHVHLNTRSQAFVTACLKSIPHTLPSTLRLNLSTKSVSSLSRSQGIGTMTSPRSVQKAFLAVSQSEGMGARVRRSIGTPNLRNFSPFLMLDHFSVSPGAGFPDHPHRGQETITYMLSGVADHEDFAGNKGTIETGDLQFMTAGRGIVHSEMPRPNDDGSPAVGMQLWVDLPENLKLVEPRYRDLRAKEIPTITVDNDKVIVKIISGKSHGTDSVKDLAYTPVWIFDVIIRPGGKISQDLPEGWNAFAYTLEGSTNFGKGEDKTTVGQYHNVVFEQKGDSVVAEVSDDAKENGRFCKFSLAINSFRGKT